MPGVVGPLKRQLRSAVSDATLAASVHNSQPWHFTMIAQGVAVRVDPTLRPRIIDRQGRWLLQSLGAAIANLELGMRVRTGRTTRTQVFPDLDPHEAGAASGATATLTGAVVAVVEIADDARGDPLDDRLHTAILERRTSRGPLYGDLEAAAWDTVMAAASAAGDGWHIRALRPDPAQTAALVDLTRAVEARWRDDVAYLAEVQRWTKPDGGRGIPPTLIGPGDPSGNVPRREFAVSPTSPRRAPAPSGDTAAPSTDVFEVSPRLLVLAGAPDGPTTWVRAGAAMQRAMLAATAEEARVGFLGQVVEDDEARARAGDLLSLRDEALLQVLRLGAVDPTRHPRRSPRRPLREVLG
ncbi:nitroreductase family protein [Xylanimonas ulmi]|uniref:Nitroreductase family protein n=1 Tax=Xylanimonas ulmi TaxID=228973 RepID=A0A4V2EXK5_9MICO|nr:nitroreductase family protein [Xylanibacterium ulmi]RZS59810.1 nitroreductase family protein [Xylanibacterium ulmi]